MIHRRAMTYRSSRRALSTSRRGVAASELAVCLPVLVLLVLAMIEACTMIFLKQSLTIAAYEGARMSLAQEADDADVQAAADGVLRDRRVQGARVTIRPADITRVAPGEYIEVTVSAPTDPNSVIPGSFLRGRTLSATAVMMKEF
jgi:Flp pilus assembly protein TadG